MNISGNIKKKNYFIFILFILLFSFIMVVFLLIVVVFLLGFIVIDLEKFLPRYLDEHYGRIEKRLNELWHIVLHSKTKDELKRIEEWENQESEKEKKKMDKYLRKSSKKTE